MIRSKRLRDAARGQLCTVNIVGVCNGNPETTVFAHLPDESGGMGLKSDDISGCDACSDCHAVIDGRAPWPEWEIEHKRWYLMRAQIRTLRRRAEMGVLKVEGDRG